METPPKFPELPPLLDLVEIRLEDHFSRWVAMGEGRSFKAVAELVNMDVSEVILHAQRHHWRERLGIISTQAGQVTMDRMVESVADLNQVHVGELRTLREKALDKLKNSTLLHDRDAIKLFIETVRLERQILGLDAESDRKDLVALLSEQLKKVQARVVEPGETHEFELSEGLGQEPLELLEDGPESG